LHRPPPSKLDAGAGEEGGLAWPSEELAGGGRAAVAGLAHRRLSPGLDRGLPSAVEDAGPAAGADGWCRDDRRGG